MKSALLTVVAVVLLLHQMRGDPFRVDHTIQPCQNRSNRIRYDDFVKKHILKERFDRKSLTQWERYQRKQQFLVKTICIC